MSEALSLVMGTSGQRDNPMRPPGDHVRCHMPDHSLITQRGQWIRVSKQTWDYSAYVPGITAKLIGPTINYKYLSTMSNFRKINAPLVGVCHSEDWLNSII